MKGDKMSDVIYKVTLRSTSGMSMNEVYGRVLSDVLQKLCNKFGEHLFMPIFDVPDEYKNDPHFQVVKVAKGTYGVVVENLEIVIPERNRFLCGLRAKREQCGLSIPQMSELVGEPSYKSKECGSREMTLTEYARYILALETYEQESKS